MDSHETTASGSEEHTHDHVHAGVATLVFMGKYVPISSLHYRLQCDGEIYQGQSSGDGEGGSLILIGHDDDFIPSGLPEPVWLIQKDAKSFNVEIEVRRDDGTWKNIGNFQIQAGKNKEITAQIDTVAVPFQLGLIE
ncbi:hypothetical protein CUZ56_00408 [Saezia sanguinis]|uniref:Uncharacterized protein n=1 Tax=Saezia sanguinis TaxID=1965230 RepID=A0A433SGP6_9BURK|nr:hypothetical protein [Saezia sanguinis]RUS67927.1 hypothetical protein CUZ56_00408 [Saezia sanguinis]